MTARGDEYGRLVRSLMTPLAERYGLDYGVEILAFYDGIDKAAGYAEQRGYTGPPGTSDAAVAFALVFRGAALLGGYHEPTDMPTTSRRVAKRVSRWMKHSYRTDAGREAAILLAQALGIQLSRVNAINGYTREAETHLKLVDLVQQHYVLAEPMRSNLLEQALAEYEGGCPVARRT